MNRVGKLGIFFGFITAFLFGCEKASQEGSAKQTEHPVVADQTDYRQDNQKLWQSAASAVNQSKNAFQNLQNKVNSFLLQPSQESLLTAQTEWTNALITYANIYFFNELSIVQPESFQLVHDLDYRIAADSLQPGYLDTFGPYPYSGLVHDIGIPIDEASLLKQHGLTDNGDVCLGLFAIEYMLYGEGKNRKWQDYIAPTTLTKEQKQNGFKSVEEVPNYRRRLLLAKQTALLVKDINALYPVLAPGGVIDESVWKTFYGSQQASAISATLERALTDLLVQIIELKKTDDNPPDPLDYKQGYSLNIRNSAKLIANKLASARVTKGYFENGAIFDPLQAAQTSLANYANSEQASSPPWQSAYDNLKTAIESLKRQKQPQR